MALNATPSTSSAGVNVVALTFTAPSSGYVFAQGGGSCSNVTTGQNLRFEVSTSSATLLNDSTSQFASDAVGTPGQQLGFAVSKMLAVGAGPQTIYLVGKVAYGPNPSSVLCGAHLTVLFASSLLP